MNVPNLVVDTREPAPSEPVAWLPLTKTGRPKRRYTWKDKLRSLDPLSSPRKTKSRLKLFKRIFAFRYTGGIVTRIGQGPKAWTTLRHPLCLDHIVRHLLADRLPSLQVQWAGARSLKTSLYCLVDVDIDRNPQEHPTGRNKPPFLSRCAEVESALAKLGIDPGDPAQVLQLDTPSGGRWYLLFFDKPYFVDQFYALLNSVGLRHRSGYTEMFPRTDKGIRLPFGHLPGRTHAHRAWIRFVDDYRQGRIKRFSLKELWDNQIRLSSSKSSQPVVNPDQGPPVAGNAPRIMFGPTKRQRAAMIQGQMSTERYLDLVRNGPHSQGEAQELMELGIRVTGTRTEALKRLAAHLIWFRKLPAGEAADQLTTWAMEPRHESKDIHTDLAEGTTRVAAQIRTMCRWYESHQRHNPSPTPRTFDAKPFAIAELEALRSSIESLPAEEREKQAHFYLHFLAFAKQHGQIAADGSGWRAAPAIRAVVRKWPGCHHMNYKTRMGHAEAAGLFSMVEEKWQRPGGRGKARTYRLAVSIQPREQWTLDYSRALAILTDDARISDRVDEEARVIDQGRKAEDGQEEADHECGSDQHTNNGTDRCQHHATTVPATGPGRSLEPSARECHPQPHAAPRLPDQAYAELPPVPTSNYARTKSFFRREAELISPCDTERAANRDPDRHGQDAKQERSLILQLLADPFLPPKARRMLAKPVNSLTAAERQTRTYFLDHVRSRS